MDNACKYGLDKENNRIHLETRLSGRHLAIRVRDNGPGVPREVEKQLFRPFSKSAKRAAHSAPGVGLGLALSRRLAREMGGDLTYDKSAKKGACFILTLPLVRIFHK